MISYFQKGIHGRESSDEIECSVWKHKNLSADKENDGGNRKSVKSRDGFKASHAIERCDEVCSMRMN